MPASCLSYFYVSNSPLFSPSTNILSFSAGDFYRNGILHRGNIFPTLLRYRQNCECYSENANFFTACIFQANHIQRSTFCFIIFCSKCLWIPVFNPAINITTGALLIAIVKIYFRFETYMDVRWHYLGTRLQTLALIPAWTSSHMPSKVWDKIT